MNRPLLKAAKWSAEVRRLLSDEGIRVVQTPWRAPNAKAYAERFVRSIKHECLDRVIPLSERHLRHTVCKYIVHYHRERNHQGLANELIEVTRPFVRAAFAGVYDSVVFNYDERAA